MSYSSNIYNEIRQYLKQEVVELSQVQEMIDRGYNVSPEWLDKNYRGKTWPPYEDLTEKRCAIPSIVSMTRIL
ncbi:putative type II DNA modification enzyme [Streptococcus oralis]|uniref:Putative type II DNA modification enzyme n=1 Tax=Streptococcus oralis TaxID=1303 RepID=A0A139PGD5_STROR|nr:putative type II DNA modification enzyme [Streptococcus oralis]